MNGYHATMTMGDLVSMNWRQVNPYSITREFNKWFDFECRVHGLRKGSPQSSFSVYWGLHA